MDVFLINESLSDQAYIDPCLANWDGIYTFWVWNPYQLINQISVIMVSIEGHSASI